MPLISPIEPSSGRGDVSQQGAALPARQYDALMSRGLAIETSGRTGSLALAEGGRVIAEDEFPHGLRHAAEIVTRIDALCRCLGWRPADVAEVYVSVGPGSFTGLRIGITVAKTLAFATGAKLFAVPTVEVLARNAPQGWQNSVIVLDAKRDQIFTARFVSQEGIPVEAEPAHLDALAAMLRRAPRPVHLIGEGIPYHRQFIPDDPLILVTSAESWRASASVVAEIGAKLAREGQGAAADVLAPLYVRRPEAEEKFDEQQRRQNDPAGRTSEAAVPSDRTG